MVRKRRIVVLVSDEESQVVEALAHLEKLPISILARRLLLFQAEQRGILNTFGNNANRAGHVLADSSAVASI